MEIQKNQNTEVRMLASKIALNTRKEFFIDVLKAKVEISNVQWDTVDHFLDTKVVSSKEEKENLRKLRNSLKNDTKFLHKFIKEFDAQTISKIESNAAFFLRYDTPKHFSFETAFRQSANRELEDSQWSTVRISPEWHFTEKLTLKNAFSNYVQSQKNKNEITLVYTPALKKYADSLKFELGVAQTYYVNGNKSESVSFSTGFKL